MLNPDGPFSLYDVTGYDSMLKSVGYRVLPLLTMYRRAAMVTALTICGLPHRASLSYEPYTTELIFILNQKVQ